MRLRAALVLAFLLLPASSPAAADELSAPPLVAEVLRQHLFNAQLSLLDGDGAAALESTRAAATLYRGILRPLLAAALPDAESHVPALLAEAEDAVLNGDGPALASARSRVWTALQEASARIVFAAMADGDTATAAVWLPLREFRVSTRFSRPGADATLALRALETGRMGAEEALAVVRADLLDTCQAQLNTALSQAQLSSERGFALRQSAEAGLARGYFEILAPAWEEQRGAAALAQARERFAALDAASTGGDDEGFALAREQIDGLLKGFRAAPLSEDEQMRRAGQLLRFLALVPVEYGRGVRNGVIVNDIEIQEAYSFHEGAVAAFNDLQPTLAQVDAAVTGRADVLLDRTLTHVRQIDPPPELDATVAELNELLLQVIPEEWLTGGGDADIDVILSVLDQVGSAVRQKDFASAESTRLEAYALLELGVEQRLRGFAPEMAIRIESLFWQGTGEFGGLATLLAQQAPRAEVNKTLKELEGALEEARLALGSGQASPTAVAGNAAVIVFREGLEAVLILASLLASLRAGQQRRYRRPLLAGSLLALAATLVTWWLATNLLNVLLPYGEVLEAVVSLISIGVLLLITNWFFHKAYWTGWMAGFHARKQELTGDVAGITSGQTIGLVLLGFTSIYREGFETVLFLQALVLEAGVEVVLRGVALGLAGTAAVGVVTFVMQVRLPYRRMFIITGIMIAGVLVTMVGHTVHVMQAIGWLPITPVTGLNLPWWMGQWFGAWATWQGLGLQFTAAVFVFGSYVLAEHRNSRRRSAAVQAARAA